MLNLETLDDINGYYLDKGIEPYWTIYYKYKYGLKLNNIIAITNKFDELHKMYPKIEINGIGDMFSYSMYYYNKWSLLKEDGGHQKPNFTYDIFGNRYKGEDGGWDKGSIVPNFNVILINHNIKYMKNKDVNLSLSNTLTHEFAHIIDETYKFYLNELFIDKYNEYIDSNSNDLGEYAKTDVREFIAVAFEKSFYTDIPRAKEVRKMIDEQYCLINLESLEPTD